jgi:hypothetical protein
VNTRITEALENEPLWLALGEDCQGREEVRTLTIPGDPGFVVERRMAVARLRSFTSIPRAQGRQMPSPSLSFRRPAFSRVAAPVFAVIFALASTAAAQPAPPPAALPPSPGLAPARAADPLEVVAPAPTAPMSSAPAAPVAPMYPPGPPGWNPPPQQWGAPQPQWGAPQPQWGAPIAPERWPTFTPPAPLNTQFYRPEVPFSLPPPVPKEAANGNLMKVGIVAAIGGVATLITGSVLMSVAKERIDVYRDGPQYCCSIDDAPMRNAGITMLVIGGITATVGIPLWMIGGRRVPVRKTTTTTAPPRTPASAAPLLRVGKSGASLSWQF